MFAPRLLVSPDLVPRAVPAGLAPARSARPRAPSRPQRPLHSGPADDITQRDTCRIAQLEGSGSRPQVHARYIAGRREVHPAAGTRVPHRPASRSRCGLSDRKTVRPSMRDHPGPDDCCRVVGRGRAGVSSCRFGADGTAGRGEPWVSRGSRAVALGHLGLVSQGSGISWLCDAASSGAARLPVSSGTMPSCCRSASRLMTRATRLGRELLAASW
jgi:hypothetical protein